jgi:class 3 adenylate cyclase
MDLAEINTDLVGEEKGKIEAYIQRHHTAMLTVMFTDIEGYTELTERQGDSYVAKLRQYHDALLKTIIEENGAGMVVKFIGDAVMAVFSEPSAGVKRAIDIQLALKQFNLEHTEFEDISVRIGLHVGQIAVEDDVQMDIFGRHVNRAARVESLAAGGQILVTYPVWDSAKGWLDSADEIECAAHGAYLLKGIPEPIEIFEVYLPEHKKPSAPAKGKVKTRSGVMKWVNVAIVVVLAAYFGLSALEKDSLLIKTTVTEDIFLNGELLNISPADEEGFRSVANELERGLHRLSYQVSPQLGYVTDIEVTKGRTLVTPEFTELRLPSLSLRNYADQPGKSKSNAFSFETYSAVEYQGEWALAVSSDVIDGSSVQHNVKWQVSTNVPEEITLRGVETLSHNLADNMQPFEDIELKALDGITLRLTGFTANKLIDTSLKFEFNE